MNCQFRPNYRMPHRILTVVLTTLTLAGLVSFLTVLTSSHSQAWGQQAQQAQQSQSPSQPAPTPSVWHKISKNLKDNAFGYSILFLFLTTAISSIIASIFKDKCLKDFNRYVSVVELRDNFSFGGKLRIENTGLELVYEPVCSDNDVTDASYILYKSEYNKLHALARYHDMLSKGDKKKRDRDIDRAYHPNIFRRTRRKIRNTMISVKDAMIEGFSLTMNQFKRTMSQSQIMQSQSQYLDRMGKTVITQGTATAYDPLIDKLIGLKVVVEVSTADGSTEYVGILKEYSSEFIELLDVEIKRIWQIALENPNKIRSSKGVQAQISGDSLLMVNNNVYPLRLKSVEYKAGLETEGQSDSGEIADDHIKKNLDLLISAHTKQSVEFHERSAILHFESSRKVDLILPRSYSLVRHRLETYAPNILDELNQINPFDDIKSALESLKERDSKND